MSLSSRPRLNIRRLAALAPTARRTMIEDVPQRWAAVPIWFAVLAWTAWWAWLRARPSGISWHYFDEGSGLLLDLSAADGGLHLYAAHPELQIGPVALLVAAVLAWLPGSSLVWGQVLMTACLPACLAVLQPLVPGRSRARLIVVAGLVAPTWTVLSVRWAHLDDALALLLLCGALRAVRADRDAAAGLALGLAAATKPWAVLGFALLVLLPKRRAGVGLSVAGLVVTAAWGPFLATAPETVRALHPPVAVADSSLLALLGHTGDWTPGWVRTTQLLMAPLAALMAIRHRAWTAALLCGIAARLLVDPQDLAYYAGSAVLAAGIHDLVRRPGTRHARWFPTATVTCMIALWQPFVHDYDLRLLRTSGPAHWWYAHPTAVAVIHLTWIGGTLLWFLTDLRRQRPRTAPDVSRADHHDSLLPGATPHRALDLPGPRV